MLHCAIRQIAQCNSAFSFMMHVKGSVAVTFFIYEVYLSLCLPVFYLVYLFMTYQIFPLVRDWWNRDKQHGWRTIAGHQQ